MKLSDCLFVSACMDDIPYSKLERLYRSLLKDASISHMEEACRNEHFIRFLHDPKLVIERGFYDMWSLWALLMCRTLPSKRNHFSLFDNSEEEEMSVLTANDVDSDEISAFSQILGIHSIHLIPFYNRCTDSRLRMLLGLSSQSSWVTCFCKSYFACRKSGFLILLCLLRHIVRVRGVRDV